MSASNTTWNPELYTEKHAFVYNYGESLVELLAPKPHETILDLGCGSGQLTALINESANAVIGIDKSPEMIAHAKDAFPHICFEVATAEDFSFSEKFDSIFSNATLHWVKDYKSVIKCMFNNLNPGGKLVLEFGGKGNVQTIVNQLKTSLREHGFLQQSELNLWYFPSIGEYTSALESEGFRVVLAEHYDRPTELADENSGIKDWINMFAKSFFEGIPEKMVEEIKTEVQEKIKDKCLINGKWYADYKRIRVVALKED